MAGAVRMRPLLCLSLAKLVTNSQLDNTASPSCQVDRAVTVLLRCRLPFSDGGTQSTVANARGIAASSFGRDVSSCSPVHKQESLVSTFASIAS